ncbi:hypothetical protein KY329_00645, partial [Candidatus Woesearchaeota archaeon]|nr:hypothetical protein [Candidatus Woesearchaeota archaeon]
MTEIIVATEENREQLIEFFREQDTDWKPPLSQRNGGIERFVDEAYEQDGTILLCGTPIEATLAYFPFKEGYYVHWQSSSRKCRGGVRIIKLYIHATKIAEAENPQAMIYGETWPENDVSKKTMEILGMQKFKEYLHQDIGLRYFYKAPIITIINRIKENRALRRFFDQ